jgi:hypothetical protein
VFLDVSLILPSTCTCSSRHPLVPSNCRANKRLQAANVESIHVCSEIQLCQYHNAAVPEYEDFAAAQLCSISKAVQEAGQAQGPLKGGVLRRRLHPAAYHDDQGKRGSCCLTGKLRSTDRLDDFMIAASPASLHTGKQTLYERHSKKQSKQHQRM